MPWNCTVFDSTGKIKDVRTLVPPLLFPLLGTNRQGSKNYAQDGTLAADDRAFIGQLDACILGGFLGSQMDETPPPSGWIARTQVSIEILAAHAVSQHFLYTYLNNMEASDTAGSKKTYIDAVDGPGSQDGWARDKSEIKVVFFPGSFGINFSDFVAEDGNGDRYPQWHSDNIVQVEYIDPHIAAGVKIGGVNGINGYWDNYQLHSNKSKVDWDASGTGGSPTNDDASRYYDSENATHVATDPVAVIAYSSWRVNIRLGLKRTEDNNPGFLVGGNTNQWFERKSGPVSVLRNVILEYRLNGDDTKTHLTLGFSENNSRDVSIGSARCGADPAGVRRTTGGGSWQESYNSAWMPVRALADPAFLMFRWRVQCLQASTDGPGEQAIYPNEPDPASIWHFVNWTAVTSWLCSATYCPSGIKIGTPNTGNGRSTPIFDFFGLTHTATTKLFRKWMGPAIDPIQDEAKFGTLWGRELTNAYLLLNPSLTSDVIFDTTQLPGGTDEWMLYQGASGHDPKNDGSFLNATLTVPKIDAWILVRRPWYEAL